MEVDHVGDSVGPRDPHHVATELQSLLLGADGIESFLSDVARRAAGAVEGALACGVIVEATSSSRMLGATTDEFARRMDAIQYEVNDGPCMTCLREGVVVVVDDVAADGRWSAFSRRGRQEGVGASMSVPMLVRDQAVGAVNLYAKLPHELTEDDLQRARQFADQAAGAVALAVRLAEREEHGRHLETALRSRTTIDQAIGILMGQARITAAQAFELLRLRSQHTNVKLREVAAEVIAEVTADGP